MKKNTPLILLVVALAATFLFAIVYYDKSNDLSGKLELSQKLKADLMVAVQDLEAAIDNKDNFVTENNKQVADKIARLMDQLNSEKVGFHKTEKLKTMLETRLSNCLEALGKKEKEVHEQTLKITQLNAQVHDLSNWVNSNEKKMKDLGERYEVMSTRLGELNGSLERQQKTCDDMVMELKKRIKDKRITVEANGSMPKLTILGKVLFDFSEITITDEGKKILGNLGDLLKTMKKENLWVSGHADNVLLKYENRYNFESNWEISTARATAVVRYFQITSGIDPKIMTAVGHSYYHPVADNNNPLGRSRNRRVEIMIEPLVEE